MCLTDRPETAINGVANSHTLFLCSIRHLHPQQASPVGEMVLGAGRVIEARGRGEDNGSPEGF